MPRLPTRLAKADVVNAVDALVKCGQRPRVIYRADGSTVIEAMDLAPAPTSANDDLDQELAEFEVSHGED